MLGEKNRFQIDDKVKLSKSKKRFFTLNKNYSYNFNEKCINVLKYLPYVFVAQHRQWNPVV